MNNRTRCLWSCCYGKFK